MAETKDATNDETDAAAAPAKKAAAKKTATKKAAPTKKAAAKKAAPTKAAPSERASSATATVAGAGEDRTRSARKVREGVVASTSMDKTAVVLITTRKPHPLYRKTMVRTSRLNAHDESNELRVGDRVRIAETRPLSKTKRWRLVEILERAK
jgi:small subunit ribosomal protein S17